ncbi:CD209 antigen-like [Thalassophryne amazonica]|uniref:CD209 antigen-like n=1 Tax=Thalassophryne amazonica TaxID=390379 RepID=UPI0014716C6D|nr:CD209 antigen-like [Thalassophryne amazonica]
MSVAFTSMSEEVGVDKWNLMSSDDRSHGRGRSRSSVCWTMAVALCLELLCIILLAVILSFMAQKAGARHEQETRTPAGQLVMCENLTHHWLQLQSSYNDLFESRNRLQAQYFNVNVERNALKNERDQVKTDYNNLNKRMVTLQEDYNTVVAQRNKLQEQVKLAGFNETEAPCILGWIWYNLKCYYVSPKGMTKTWQDAQRNCVDQGAHLVIISSQQEQDFVTSFYDRTWIGLNDKETESKFKWVDGTPLQGQQFWQSGEPNDNEGGEDCVEASRNGDGWNDLPCRLRFSWICERS